MEKWLMMLALLWVWSMPLPIEATPPERVTKTPAISHPGSENATSLLERAYDAYRDGKRATQANVRSTRYAAAIDAISRAAVLQPDNTDVLLLASQIYRSKGGTAFAKEYFARAESILVARIAASPKDIGAILDYAIACYAGDARFKNNYDSYQKNAHQHADEVIRLTSQSAEPTAAQLRVMAFAYLVKGDTKRCGKILSQAAQSDAISKSYSDFFVETVEKGEWLWPVSADSSAKEFLLYVLTDSARYSGL